MLDQLCKWYLLEIYAIGAKSPVEVTSFFRLVMVWNYGVSFGMFSEPGTASVGMLVGVAAVMVAIMSYWLLRANDRFTALAIGMIIGGAIGNVIDRLRFSAVADFFDFHIMHYHWPAFNIADSFICIGVALLVWDGFVRRKPSPSS